MEKLAAIPPSVATQASRIMRVITVSPQLCLRCEDSGEQLTAVDAAVLPAPLQPGDRVLAQSTLQGWVITALLAGERMPLVAMDDDGRLSLQCDKGIRLQVADARIDIAPDGCITVDGKEVHTLASGLQRILGATVQIN